MDLTKLSDADLLALHKGDLQSISDEGLSVLSSPATKPQMSDENALMQIGRAHV